MPNAVWFTWSGADIHNVGRGWQTARQQYPVTYEEMDPRTGTCGLAYDPGGKLTRSNNGERREQYPTATPSVKISFQLIQDILHTISPAHPHKVCHARYDKEEWLLDLTKHRRG